MKQEQYNVDAMSDALDELGIVASPEQIESLTDSFMTHIECMRDMENMRFFGSGNGKREECYKCKEKDEKIKELENDIEICLDGVRKRRNTDDVYIDRTCRTIRYNP